MSKRETKYRPDPPPPADSHNVLDMLTATAKSLGWQPQGASTSAHWVTLTVTDGSPAAGPMPVHMPTGDEPPQSGGQT